jgi:hypothetical protein
MRTLEGVKIDSLRQAGDASVIRASFHAGTRRETLGQTERLHLMRVGRMPPAALQGERASFRPAMEVYSAVGMGICSLLQQGA